ncbi:hypothetical protein GCM10023185_36920 [Hymenobacter saemangeumensis]|uniref:Uncharacterized protein n=1 Tax=Hymenobacter saemangeumensis TaxID=1084522 RepID=A0ABP8IQ18_9BACT
MLDLLGADTAAVGKKLATTEAAPTAQAPAAAAEVDTVPQALYTNPLTEATGTKNDEANRKAEVELKKRARAALRTGTEGQKAALAALITEATAPG